MSFSGRASCAPIRSDRIALNIAAFQTDIEGAQQYEFVPTVGLQTTVSIDKVEVKGFDADFQAFLPGEFTLFGGYGFTDAEVADFVNAGLATGIVAQDIPETPPAPEPARGLFGIKRSR